ncbi:MAG: hypothetical protein JXR26_10700, partial [Balneolaceae bacterium]|nr:hypothetical protein [Balneolaceae bacterium]
ADLLKHYVAKHKKVSFAAVTGRWKPNKQKYKYKARALTFPDSVLQQANGETIFYDYYQHREDQDKIQRKLATGAIQAVAMMLKAFRKIIVIYLICTNQQKILRVLSMNILLKNL